MGRHAVYMRFLAVLAEPGQNSEIDRPAVILPVIPRRESLASLVKSVLSNLGQMIVNRLLSAIPLHLVVSVDSTTR